MTPRRRRIERILAHRQKELDEVAAELAAANARLAAAVRDAEAADGRVRAAEEMRRGLGASGSDARAFLEAAEWLASAAQGRERAWATVAVRRSDVASVQERVMAARMKLRQGELLAARIDAAERKVEQGRERRRDDEHAARIAHRKRAVAGSK